MLSQVTLSRCTAEQKLPAPFKYRGPRFSFSGLQSLNLLPETTFLGLACGNCKILTHVDLSCTAICAIHESTFSHCVSLLRKTLRDIHKKAFMACCSLQSVDVPLTLRYGAHKAFFDYSQLTHLALMANGLHGEFRSLRNAQVSIFAGVLLSRAGSTCSPEKTRAHTTQTHTNEAMRNGGCQV